MAENVIMAHMIPFFPDETNSFAVAEALIESGIRYLEVQFPFTDPTADGPVIEAACTEALKQGFTVDKGFAFVRSLSELCARSGVDVYIMTYASLVFARGIGAFADAAVSAGAGGLIVPDLPLDSDEGLYAICAERGLYCVPVVVPSITAARLKLVQNQKPALIYCALRSGITGTRTELSLETLTFLKALGAGGSKILGGFGISDPDQVRALKSSVHAIVVGSAIMRTIQAAVRADGTGDVHGAVSRFVRGLVAA